jgi:hypothetical protein
MSRRKRSDSALLESLEPRLLLSNSADVSIVNPTLSVGSVGPGQTINNVQINYTIHNNSATPITNAGYVVDIYLSYDTNIAANDTLIGTKLDFTDVAANSSNGVVDSTVTLTIPGTVEFSTYYLGYHLRSNGGAGDYSDPNDANNWIAGPQILIDSAGNTLASARNLGAISPAALTHISDETLGQTVGAVTDTDDYYRFTANGMTTVCVNLHSYQLDANYRLSLLDSGGTPISTVTTAHLGQAALTRNLAAGTYYVRMECITVIRTQYELWLGGPQPTNVSWDSLSVPPSQTTIRPGAAIDVTRTFNVSNATAQAFSISYYLSTDGAAFTAYLGAENIPAGSAVGAHTATTSLTVPQSVVSGDYTISASLYYWDGPQSLTADDLLQPAQPVLTIVPSFALGKDAGHPTKATFVDASGDTVVVSYSGPGRAEITLAGGVADGADIGGINIAGSNIKSALTITAKGKGAFSTMGPIAVHGSIKSITAKNIDLVTNGTVWGQISIEGAAKSIHLRDMISSEIKLGAAADSKVAIAIRSGLDSDIDSEAYIKSFTCVSWGTSPNYVSTRITAPSVGTIKSTGKGTGGVFSGALVLGTVGVSDPLTKILGSLKVAGDMSPYEWVIWGRIGSISVKGAITSEEIIRMPNCWVYGSIDSFTAGACRNVFWQVGLKSALQWADGGYVASSASDFDTNLSGVIKSLKITGIKHDTAEALSNAGFSASQIDSVSIVSNNPPGTWNTGVFTHQLKKFSYKNLSTHKSYKWLFAAGAPAGVTDMVHLL